MNLFTKQKETHRLRKQRDSQVIQWLRLCAFTAEGVGSIPGQGTEIPQAASGAKKERKKKKERARERKQTYNYQRGRGRDKFVVSN